MMVRKNRFLMGMAMMLMLIVFANAFAQEKMGETKKMGEMKGVQGSFLKQSKFVENQFVQLAQVVPQEKYTWRPMEGVRSIAECFLHAATGNYAVLQTLGAKVPEGFNVQTFEKSTTDKARIIEEVKKSFAAVNDYVSKIPDADLEKHVNFIGMDMTVLDMIMVGATHQHELLGQGIAYARMNKVVPPWTAEMQAKMKQQQEMKK